MSYSTTLHTNAVLAQPATRRPPARRRDPFWHLKPTLQNVAKQLVTILDAEGHIRYASPPFEAIFGRAGWPLVGAPLRAFVVPAQRPRFDAVLADLRSGTRFDAWTLTLEAATGDTHPLEGRASNFLDDPRLGGVLVYWLDVVET
jgi:PAS domain-containing protein